MIKDILSYRAPKVNNKVWEDKFRYVFIEKNKTRLTFNMI